MVERLKAVWEGLDKAESSLVGAGVRSNPELLATFFDGCLVSRNDFALLFRLAAGFDPDRLTSRDYLNRYPFSTLDLIDARLSALVEMDCLDYKRKIYAVTGTGWELLHGYYNVVAGGIDRLVLESVSPEEIEYLLQMDRRLVEGCAAADVSYERPILKNRLHGFRPPYEPLRLSHHWQRIWTLNACREDAGEAVRERSGLDPLVWFARGQIKTRRFEIGNADDLARVARRYAPVTERACQDALQSLINMGWIFHGGEIFRMTGAGQRAFEQDEQQIDRLFFASWPELSEVDGDRLVDITSRLNAELK